MAEPKTIEEALALVQELRRTYEEVSQTEIPRSIKEAKDQGWTLIPKGIAVAGLTHYEGEQRDIDSTRVISLPTALRIMEDFEDGLLLKTVHNPKQVFVRKTRGTIRFYQSLISGAGLLWDFAKATVSVWDILDLLAYLARLGFIFDLLDPDSRLRAFAETIYELALRFGLLICTGIISMFAVPVFSATVLDVEKEREFWVAKMRKAALPQGNQRRVWRRKVSRL